MNTREIADLFYGKGWDIDGKPVRKTMSYGEFYTKRREEKKTMEITNVIFNDPATIVFWSDGTKTVVKCSENDEFDPEKGLAMAIVKKAYGNDNTFHKIFKTWVKEEDKYVGPTIKLEGNLLKEALNNTLDRISDSISRK